MNICDAPVSRRYNVALHADAIGALTDAIDLIGRLPDSPERVEQEHSLVLTVGPSLFAIKGHGSPEAVRAYTRARDLCDQLNNSPEVFPMLYGSCFMHWLRGEFRTAYEVANDLMRRAQIASDPAMLFYAHHAFGQFSCFMGNLRSGLAHLKKAISLYDPAVHSGLTSRYVGFDAKVHCQGVLAIILLTLGYPEQAMTTIKQVRSWARTLSQPYSLIFSEYMTSALLRDLNDVQRLQEQVEQGIAQYGEPNFEAFMSVRRGWAIALQGHGAEGVDEIRDALETLRARGIEMDRPWDLSLFAEACRASGRLDDGLVALSEALNLVEEQENRLYEAEIHRLRGELLLITDQTASAEAAQCFRDAIEIAQRQGAKWWELRATTSLTRLLASQDRGDDARTMLAEIYHWFTEGFDTADLKDVEGVARRTQHSSPKPTAGIAELSHDGTEPVRGAGNPKGRDRDYHPGHPSRR